MRRRSVAVSTILLAAGLLLLAWSQAWFLLVVEPGTGAPEELVIGGDAAGAAVLAIALATAAVAAVLALAGPRLRILLGVVIALLGVGAAAAAGSVLAAPEAVFERVIAEMTGLAGSGALDSISSAAATVWPIVAIGGGVLIAVLGAWVVVVSRQWTAGGRRYERDTAGAGDRAGTDPTDTVATWDSLSHGGDPTADGTADPTR